HRKVKRLGQVHEPREFLGCVLVPDSAVVVGLAGQHGHRPSIQASQSGDDAFSPVAADLEERARVHHAFEYGADLVHLARITRNGIEQSLVAAPRMVREWSTRHKLKRRARQVWKKTPGPR